ncbi:uncharacterized protein [Leptinotarsa decemlineata]|uniref:uncharacterized protein n=1 Tax=Leptinotarsa decemlineata TaxID=7539 RepID=UPI003D306CB5
MIAKTLINLVTKSPIIRNSNFSITKRLLNNKPRNRVENYPRRAYTRLPKTPDLIYIPHVIRWLKTKFQFKYLKRTWDPEFTEGAFIYGTSKAVCRITEIIHENDMAQLDGLLTDSAKMKLKQDLKTRITKAQRAIIKLKPEDIKILVPMNVCLKEEGLQRNCRVGMRVLALKWIQQKTGALRLVLVALQTEFMKEYREGGTSDWTISAFDIMECAILTQSPS